MKKLLRNSHQLRLLKKGGIFKSSMTWLTQEFKHLIGQKHFLFNKWKKIPYSETYKEFKGVRNLVNRKIREAHNNFCINFFQNYQQVRNKGNSLSRRPVRVKNAKIDEIRLECGEISREPQNIVNCLNRSFANLGVFKVSDIACKYPDKLIILVFTFKNVTRKEFIQSLTHWTTTKQQDLVKSHFDSY